MFNHLTETARERIYLAIVVCIGLLRFINLGFIDVQAWDEALYAIRAEGILRFGGWIDQTAFAIDGLYSSLHPPLYVWLTALTFNFLGFSEFSVRCVSAVMGLITVILIYRIGRKLENPEVGLIAAVLFGLNPFISFYARQGQFDTTVVFFLTLAVYVLLTNDHAPSIKQSALAGLAVGASLMTKLYVGLGLPIAYALYILAASNMDKPTHWKRLGIMTFTALLIAAPWHIYMTLVHGNGDPFFFFTASALWERSVSGIEGNVKPLEVLYFVNQMFVLFPAGVLWFGYGLWNILRSKNISWLLLASWFVFFFLVFSVMRTKLAVYLLPMLVPASLIAAREFWKAKTDVLSHKTIVVLLGGTLFAILWSTSQLWRNQMKDVFLLRLDTGTLLSLLPFFGVTLGILVICFLMFRRNTWIHMFRKGLLYLIGIPSLLLSVYYFVFVDVSEYNDGGHQLAQFIQEQGIERLVVAGYERNPQLTYYLDGVDIGWRDDISIRRIIPPKDSTEFAHWLLGETLNEPPSALLILEKDKFARYKVINPLLIAPPDYALMLSTKRYACFLKVKNDHLARYTQ